MRLGELWRRPEARFLVLFLAVLGSSFTVIALRPVDTALVAPYTAFVARLSGSALRLLGEQATVVGCVVSSPRFAVTIFNGCNGLITSLIFISGVLAFPARWSAKVIGVVGGLLAIQVINLVRVVSLFYIGIYFPALFNDAHIVVWQSVVILAGVALWIAWAELIAAPGRRAT
ncbi:MAG: exosortase H [Thermoanaerobaculales bacterium]|jgi:exosortase H (IPTLxxWG-CTERM-specific)|nr:exosortase H [Thermoanaerobaculales bacterium]